MGGQGNNSTPVVFWNIMGQATSREKALSKEMGQGT